MGLLDDAIREHLDLKRARGGDPAEIERMEREALGPVRREPTIGSTRFEAAEEHGSLAPEGGYPDDRDQLLEAGYHDSTAPHPHARQEHLQHGHDDPHLGHEHDDPFDAAHEEQEQPKRRFLRRSRSAPMADSGSLGPGFHEEHAVDPHELIGHDDQHDALGYHAPLEPLEHHDLPPHVESPPHHESLAHHDLHEQHDAPVQAEEAEASQPPVPPHLQFDHPPKRPRFSAEPPELHAAEDAGLATGGHEPVAPASPPSRAEDETGAQETTEFDVQKHIAETRLQPDPETQVQPGIEAPVEKPGAERDEAPGEEEDVLEETPEFLQDTPEHDRLWFEQRPPRDFDFDG